mgnify:CR=1 FL=1
MRIRKNARGSARGNEKGKEAGKENPRRRLLQNTQQTKEIVSEMNFQLKLREEDAAKG